jgi:hypothetical protein
MANRRGSRPQAGRLTDAVRLVVGLIWLAGAVFNLVVTTRMSEPYAWLEETPVAPYRWFFDEVVGKRPVAWTVALATGEIVLGSLTLSRRGRARIGLLAGSAFSAFLVSLATPYTLVMAPYAALLMWLSRFDFEESLPGKLAAFGSRAMYPRGAIAAFRAVEHRRLGPGRGQ